MIPDNKKHNFISVKDVLKKNWDSKFILGPLKGIRFHEFMDQNSDKSRVGDGAKRPHKILVESQLKAVSSDSYEKLIRCEQD